MKSVDAPADAPEVVVAPFAGAWIEMYNVYMDIDTEESRSLRGSVD